MLLSLLSAVTDVPELTGQVSKVLDLVFTILKSNGLSSDLADSILGKFGTSYSIVTAGFTLLMTLLGCFLGYKLCRFFMGLSGFLAGLIIGAVIAVRFLDPSNGTIILCSLAGGILLSIFAFKIYQAGIFVLCFFLAFVAAASILPLTGDLQFFACTVCGFVIGTLALKYVRPVIILTSAIVCAHMAVKPLLFLAPLTKIAFFEQPSAGFLSFAALFILGTIIQFLTTKDPGEKAKKRKARKRNKKED